MNETIFALSQKNRELEKQLFNEQDRRNTSHYSELSAREVTGILQQIFNDTSKASSPSNAPIVKYDIISQIYKNLPQDREFHIPSEIKGSMHLTELSFQFLNGITESHTDIQRLLQLLAISWAQLSVHSPDFLQVTQHPAKQVLSKLLMLGECWDQRSGNLAKKLLDGIRLVLQQLNQKGAHPKLFEQAAKRITTLESAFNQYRTERLKQIVEQRRKEEREIKADKFVAEFIQEKTSGEEFPVFLLEFLENYLSPYLKSIFMDTGPVGQHWHQAIEDSETLIWSITAHVNKEFTDTYQERVPPALKRLYEGVDKLFSSSEGLQDFFYELEDIHIRKLNGERPDFYTIITSPLLNDLELEEESRSSNDYSAELDEILSDDDWYYLIQQGKRFRCQLVPREYTGRWLVFVNLSGAQIASFDTEAATFDPHNLPLVSIDAHNYWQELTEYLQDIMQRRISVLEQQLAKIEQDQAADAARKKAAEDEARAVIRLKIEEEQRKQEDKKRKLEHERALAIAKAKEEEARIEKKRHNSKRIVAELTTGAVIEYTDANEGVSKLTLSIISVTTGKYIFIDKKGQRALDPKEDSLVDLFAADRVRLLQQGKEFEDTLQSLVAGQRQAYKEFDT
ncbi:MAG: DUF1631 family protein [Kangiellaceae bacterium]|jgi:hypothetical protein|nr:DUF1631 family protein [Kangiellaceae bacterium]